MDVEEEIKKQKLPTTILDFIKFMKKQWIFALSFSAILVFYFKFSIAPNYIRDFFVIAIFNAVDMQTTFFALKYVPKVGEANPITRNGFEKVGYIRTYVKGLVYISFLLLLLYVYTTFFPGNTKTMYSFGIFGMYALVGQQPFMNLLIIINNKMKGNMPSKDLSSDKDVLIFEYQELREERSRSTSMNYQIMSILIGAVIVTISQWDKVKDTPLKEPILILMGTILISVLVIDRKLTLFNNIRADRMKEIEEHDKIKIYNLTLTDTKRNPDLGGWVKLGENITIFRIFVLIVLILLYILVLLYTQ